MHHKYSWVNLISGNGGTAALASMPSLSSLSPQREATCNTAGWHKNDLPWTIPSPPTSNRTRTKAVSNNNVDCNVRKVHVKRKRPEADERQTNLGAKKTNKSRLRTRIYILEQILLQTGKVVQVHPSIKAAVATIGKKPSRNIYKAVQEFNPCHGFLWLHRHNRVKMVRPIKKILNDDTVKYYPCEKAIYEELGIPKGYGVNAVLNGRKQTFRGEVYCYVGLD
jgi:hypothetical protein